MNLEELAGRTITNIFETKPSIIEDQMLGLASYFCIVIEIDNSELLELGAHKILNWTRDDLLLPFEKPAWAVQNNFEVIGKKITRVIQRDPKEYYDGSLTLLLDNNIIIEHQTTNGDQLFIDKFNEDDC